MIKSEFHTPKLKEYNNRMKTRKNLFIIVTVLTLLPLWIPCTGQGKKDTLNVLFVGNSHTYTRNLPHVISIISEGTSTKLMTKKSTIGAASLGQHWRGERGLRTKEIIKNGNFDIVVLQEKSMGPVNEPDSVFKYAKLFCDYIREHGGKPYLYLTWARADAPQNQEIINEVFSQIAKDNNATLVPVGKAWALAKQLKPEIQLHNPDGNHSSVIGACLTAYVFVSTITGELPEKIIDEFIIIDQFGETLQVLDVKSSDVAFCKLVAEKITQ